MTTETRPYVPAIVTPQGEVLELTLKPVSVEQAGTALPSLYEYLRFLRRYIDFHESVIADEMRERGQTERRIGETVYELKGESVWSVKDPEGLYQMLVGAQERGDLTAEEFDVVVTRRAVVSVNHTKANVLQKRVPEINNFRERTESVPRLRVKR